MRLYRIELLKCLKSMSLYLVLLTFVAVNVVYIYGNYGEKDINREIREVHNAAAAEKGDVIKGHIQTDTQKSYRLYKKQSFSFYNDLDMTDILHKKEKVFGFHPKGSYDEFLEGNYKKLQKRVEQIKRTKEYKDDFYPGDIYSVHSFLYGKLTKNLIIQMSIIVMLSIFFIMDFERVNKTRDIVIASRIGKGVMKTKALAGVTVGILFSIFLMSLSYISFFILVPFDGFWNSSVSASVTTEARGVYFHYPFITYFKMSERQYFILSIILCIFLLLLVSGICIALYLFLRNSYLAFTVQCVLFMTLYLVAYDAEADFFGMIKSLMNPAVLWITSGAWFIENEVSLSFAGSEFIGVICSGIVVVCVVAVAKFRYGRCELK